MGWNYGISSHYLKGTDTSKDNFGEKITVGRQELERCCVIYTNKHKLEQNAESRNKNKKLHKTYRMLKKGMMRKDR